MPATTLQSGLRTGGRDRPELEGLIGYFVNMQPMRSSLAGDPTFVELLGRVRRDTLDAWSHRDVTFDRIVAALNPARKPGRNPLFQVTFAIEVRRHRAVAAGPAGRASIQSAQAKFDLSVTVIKGADRLEVKFEYNRDLFEQATIERMAAHFGSLLEGIVADPHAKLSALPMMSLQEMQQSLLGWNDTARDSRRTRRCTSCSRSRPRESPMRWRSCSSTGPAWTTARSTAAPTSWRTGCAVSAWAPTCRWACTCSAAPG